MVYGFLAGKSRSTIACELLLKIMNRHYLDLIWYKSTAELRAEAARAYLGFLWWLVEPVLYMIAFYVVFALIFQRGGENFVPFLLCGLVVWKWFGSTVSQCANAIPSNAGLMNQVYIPKYLFPAIVNLVAFIKFLVIFVLLLVFLVAYGIMPTSAWLFLPVVLVIQFLFVAVVSGFVAAIVPIVPDLKMVLDNVLMLLFFISGVFFDINSVPDGIRDVLVLNPMAVIIESYRAILIGSASPQLLPMVYVFLFSMVGAWAVARMFRHYDRVYPKILV